MRRRNFGNEAANRAFGYIEVRVDERTLPSRMRRTHFELNYEGHKEREVTSTEMRCPAFASFVFFAVQTEGCSNFSVGSVRQDQ
jgi:hypothetical protein